jgi:hypothetical protein
LALHEIDYQLPGVTATPAFLVIASPDLSGRGNLIAHYRDCGACSEGTRNLAPRNDERTVTNHVNGYTLLTNINRQRIIQIYPSCAWARAQLTLNRERSFFFVRLLL